MANSVGHKLFKHKKVFLKFALSTVFMIGILAVSVYSLRILFDESLHTDEGTFAYYLAVPSLIADIPRPGQTEEPKFYVTAGDGPKAPASAIEFRSSTGRDAFFRALDIYLGARNLSRAGTLAEAYPTEWALRRTHGDEAIVYGLDSGTDLQHVIVRVEGTDGSVGRVTITATY